MTWPRCSNRGADPRQEKHRAWVVIISLSGFARNLCEYFQRNLLLSAPMPGICRCLNLLNLSIVKCWILGNPSSVRSLTTQAQRFPGGETGEPKGSSAGAQALAALLLQTFADYHLCEMQRERETATAPVTSPGVFSGGESKHLWYCF